MNKCFLVLLCLTVLYSVGSALCPFSARYNVSWDTRALAWTVDKVLVPELSVAGCRIGLFNVTSGGGDFFISSRPCSEGTKYALSRKEGVTNNACTPPCTTAFNLTSGYYFYCSSVYKSSSAGVLNVLECNNLPNYRCIKVVGCGWGSDNKCKTCIDAKTKSDCNKISNCTWCVSDGVCLHEKSGACRSQIAKNSTVASWIWLLITLIALFVLIAVMLTLFLSERQFKKRWAAVCKTDKDFAEVGKGANDGLVASD